VTDSLAVRSESRGEAARRAPDAELLWRGSDSRRYAVERRDWQRAAELQPRETPFPYIPSILVCAAAWLRLRLHDAGKTPRPRSLRCRTSVRV